MRADAELGEQNSSADSPYDQSTRFGHTFLARTLNGDYVQVVLHSFSFVLGNGIERGGVGGIERGSHTGA